MEAVIAPTESGHIVDMSNCTSQVDPTFERFIDTLARTKDERTISNRSGGHALSIFRAIFQYSKESVRIFSGALSTAVYNDEILIKYAKDFCANSGRVSVLIQDRSKLDLVTNKFLRMLSGEKINVRAILSSHPLKAATEHFIVADDRMYRIEVDIVQRVAVGSFNDPVRAKQLSALFDIHFGGETEEVSV